MSTVSRMNPLPYPALGVTCPESRVTLSQKLYLGSQVHSLQGDPPSKTLKVWYTSTVSRVTLFLTLYLGSLVHRLQGDPTTPVHAPGLIHPQSPG